jgi:hypothetical protein
MHEEKINAPVPVPPVDQSWSLMRSALDAQMPVVKAPVGKAFYLRPRFIGVLLVGAALTVVLIKVVVRPRYSSGANASAAVSANSSTPDSSAQASSSPPTVAPSTVAPSTAVPLTATTSSATALSGTASNTTSSALPGKNVRIFSKHAHESPGMSSTHRSSVSTASPGSQNSQKSTQEKIITEMGNRRLRGAGSRSNDTASGSNASAAGSNAPASRSKTPARRQTFPVGLAALSPGVGPASIRFRLADSLLRKRAMKPNNLPQTLSAAAHTLTFTAGLTLSGRFNLSQQQAAPYAINGSRNIWADYLPSVHARAYYGDTWDLQVDLTALQPQYTRSTVVDSTGGDSSSIFPFQGYRQYNVYSAKKLFYSELSASIHRRVFKGLWLGAGLTYGHLQGAVGDRQLLMKATNPGVNDTVLTSEIVSIKSNDTAYNRLSRSDWRFLLDAEYQWRRLTLGLRYERAVNSWLPVQADGARGKQNNQSFTLRISYELWKRR